MSKKDEYKSTLEEYPNLREFLPFLDIHNKESHRGSVLTACAFLDDLIKKIIDAFLIKESDKSMLLEGFNAPLGTFSARIKAAHCLGLITDTEKNDCDILRKIRNEFAHSHNANFKEQKIIALCGNLHHSAKDYGNVIVDPYGQYSTGAVGLILNLVNRPHYVGEERITKRNWKY